VDEDEQFPMIVLAARSPAKAVLLRSGEEQSREVEVQLPGMPVRVGISWRYDEAEPGSVVISQVTKGSAAFLCGLLPGDRIYEVNNERFGDEKEFRQLITADVDQIQLLIERQGRISPVTLHLLPRQVTVARPSFDSRPAENVPALAP
jgi:C-terminal processing protease CtpA/Prc